MASQFPTSWDQDTGKETMQSKLPVWVRAGAVRWSKQLGVKLAIEQVGIYVTLQITSWKNGLEGKYQSYLSLCPQCLAHGRPTTKQ